MMLQLTAYEVMDCWDAHVVMSVVTPTGRDYRRLGHDLVEGGGPDEDPADSLERMARYLNRLAGQLRERRGPAQL